MTPGLIVICGPTASGKSSLAQGIANRFSLPILNADSRQIYKDFDIGTAKPAARDRLEVSHYLVDEIDPRITFTVADYQTQAQELIHKFHQQGVTPILAGGTGLYIKSITHGLKIPRVAPQIELRSQLEHWPQSIRYEWLRQVDPNSSTKIHPNDQVRTLRALEVFYVTGTPLSDLQGESPPSYSILSLGLDIPNLDQHTKQIRHRVQQMIEMGWLEEIQRIQQQYGSTLPLLRTLGYREMQNYLGGQTSLEEAIELTTLHTRQFAKRQRTWFHAQTSIEWFDPTQPNSRKTCYQRVQEFLAAL